MVDAVIEKVRAGERINSVEALELYRNAPTALLGQLAVVVRERKHAERVVTYIIDRNVNYTNVCVARCNFCAFYRPVGSAEGYVLGFDEIFTKIDEAAHVGVVFNVVRKLNKNLSYITTGQDVPDDIEVGKGKRLAELILGKTC